MAALRDAPRIGRKTLDAIARTTRDATQVDHRLISNRAAEESVIAALLLDAAEVWREEVDRVLDPGMFFDDVCRAAYRACLWLREREYDVTVVTVAWAWAELGWIAEVDRLADGAEVWLSRVAGEHWTAYGVEAHARIVRDLAQRRDRLQHAQDEAREALGAPPQYRPARLPFDSPQRAATPVTPAYERDEYVGIGG